MGVPQPPAHLRHHGASQSYRRGVKVQVIEHILCGSCRCHLTYLSQTIGQLQVRFASRSRRDAIFVCATVVLLINHLVTVMMTLVG